MVIANVIEADPRRLASLLDDSEIWDDPREPAALMRGAGYEILGHLGSGSCGSVWRARQLAARREVALKLVHAGWFDSARTQARFEREVELTAALEHPHIARLYDSGIHRGVCFYAMELIRGVPLDRYVGEQSLSRQKVVGLLVAICRAVQHAHQRGIIHRDLKPSNILVDEAGEPHVLDFGLAWSREACVRSDLSVAGQVVGTPQFMSPEQAAASPEVDTRSDVYSLGVILYKLLTGSFPHAGASSALDLMRRVAEHEPIRPRQVDPSIDSELEAILLKALQRDPKARYESAGAMAADLERYLRGDPLSARPPTLAYFVGRRVRQHKLPIAVAIIVLVVGLAGAIFSYAHIRQAWKTADAARADSDRQRDLAEQREADAVLAQADALAAAGSWIEAKARYVAARGLLRSQHRLTLAADLGLFNASRYSPTALRIFAGHKGAVLASAFSADAQTVVSGGQDGTVRVWDVASGKQLLCLSGHEAAVTCVAFDPRGQRVASGGNDGAARIWDLKSARPVETFQQGGELVALAFSPTEGLIASASRERVRVWNLVENRLQCNVPTGASCLAFVPDGTLMTGDATGVVALWSARDGARVCGVYVGPFGITSVQPGRTCEGYAASCGDRIVNARFSDPVPTVKATIPGGVDCVTDGGSDTRRVMAVGHDAVVRSIDLVRGVPNYQIWGDGAPLGRVCFSPDRELLLSAEPSGLLKLIRASEPRQPREVKVRDRIGAMAASSDGRTLFAGTTGQIDVIDAENGLTRRTLHIPDQSAWVQAMAITADSATVLAGTDQGKVFLWTRGRGDEPLCLVQHDMDVRAAAISPDGRLGLTVNGNEAKLWDLSPGALRHEIWSKRADATFAHAAAFSGDGRRVFSVTVHGHVVGWDLDRDQQIAGLAYLDVPSDLWGNAVFSGDGSMLLSGCDKDVFLWDTRTGKRIRRMSGHGGPVSVVAMPIDGKLAISCGADNQLIFWDLTRGTKLQRLEHPVGGALVLAYARQTDRLFSAGTSRELRIWDLGTAINTSAVHY